MKFKLYPEEVAAYSIALLLCIMAIRDISIILNEKATAEKYSILLVDKAKTVQIALKQIISNPSSLFWISDIHRNVILEHQENIKRLKSQREQLKILKQQDKGFEKWKEYVYLETK
ncbi:hypothetical protein PMEGAS67_50290 [Priestia megaterium]